MLRLIETEFYKLRRKKSVWMMVLAAFLMPALSVCYFGFYKWSAFGYTTWIILPVILGIFATIIVYEEKRLQIVRQIWLVPVKEESYFFSKFCMVLVLSVGFMMLTAVASVLCSVLPGFVPFRLEDMMYLFEKCMEGFFLMPVNMYVHPITSMGAILIRKKDISGLLVTQESCVGKAVLCIFVWDIISFGLVKYQLSKRK